jgi:catechol 2,3-dioxygenase-like lactoylglutathione lyase family enzyme
MIHALDHIAVAVQDLEAAVADYAALLGRTAERTGAKDGAERAWFHLSNISIELITPAGAGAAGDRVRARLADAGEGAWLLAFAMESLAVGGRTLERRGVGWHIAASGALIGEPATTAGVHMAFIERPKGARPAPSPLTTDADAVPIGLDHVVVLSPNPDRALAIYGAKLGLDLRLDRANPAWGARQMFFRCGETMVEIGHGLKAGVSDAPDSLGGLAWRMAHPAAAQARLANAGFNVSEVRKGRKPGTEVFTVRDRTSGVPTLMLSATPADPN